MNVSVSIDLSKLSNDLVCCVVGYGSNYVADALHSSFDEVASQPALWQESCASERVSLECKSRTMRGVVDVLLQMSSRSGVPLTVEAALAMQKRFKRNQLVAHDAQNWYLAEWDVLQEHLLSTKTITN